MEPSTALHSRRSLNVVDIYPYAPLWAYMAKMSYRDRVSVAYRQIGGLETPVACLSFMMARSMSDITKFHARPLLTECRDYSRGSIIYIDYLIATEWNAAIRRHIYASITDEFTNWSKILWFRPRTSGPDRMLTITRRK